MKKVNQPPVAMEMTTEVSNEDSVKEKVDALRQRILGGRRFGNPEVWHVAEDEIMKVYIKGLAEGEYKTLADAIADAEEILALNKVSYPRWYS